MPNPNIEGKASKDRKCPILGGGEISSAYNLFGIKLKELYLGKDLLSQEESKIYFSNGDVLIGDDYYQNNNDETYIYCQYLLKKDYFQLKKR